MLSPFYFTSVIFIFFYVTKIVVAMVMGIDKILCKFHIQARTMEEGK